MTTFKGGWIFKKNDQKDSPNSFKNVHDRLEEGHMKCTSLVLCKYIFLCHNYDFQLIATDISVMTQTCQEMKNFARI